MIAVESIIKLDDSKKSIFPYENCIYILNISKIVMNNLLLTSYNEALKADLNFFSSSV